MLRKIIDSGNQVLKWTSLILLTAMVTIMCANVFSRYALRYSLTWSAELARYCMLWSAFLAAAVLVNRDEHLSMNILLQNLKGRLRTITALLIHSGSFVFFCLLVWVGLMLVRQTGNQVASSIAIPMNLVYSVIPVSGALMAFGSLYRIILLLQKTSRSLP